ncbi:hypothetical protein [Isoptericola sp. NPDC056605]|uniref:hypothetical protein n=1 Tax=Isoptericola sp. NPDC056605 TaxID=3345876 RepID=UPI0036A82C77
MDSLLGLQFPAAVGVVLAGASLLAAAALWWDGQRAVAPSAAARRAARHAALTAGVATVPLIFGILVVPTYYFGGYLALVGHRAAVLPVVSLLGLLAVHAVGEMTWPRPRGTQRQARLVARTVHDVAPGRLRRAPLTWLAGAVVVAVGFGLMASGPRSVSRVVGLDQAFTVDPFPGWLWTVSILAASTAAVVLTELVLRLVASRPAIDDVDEEWDMWLRRRVARRILRSVQLVLGWTLAGLIAVGGLSLRRLGLGYGSGTAAGAPPSSAHLVAGNMLLLAAIAVALVALVVAVWPARDVAPAAMADDEPAEAQA